MACRTLEDLLRTFVTEHPDKPLLEILTNQHVIIDKNTMVSFLHAVSFNLGRVLLGTK